jgi:hypothetical protein
MVTASAAAGAGVVAGSWGAPGAGGAAIPWHTFMPQINWGDVHGPTQFDHQPPEVEQHQGYEGGTGIDEWHSQLPAPTPPPRLPATAGLVVQEAGPQSKGAGPQSQGAGPQSQEAGPQTQEAEVQESGPQTQEAGPQAQTQEAAPGQACQPRC